MKEREWFKHDYSAASDLRIVALRSRFGMRGYGIYWALIEAMYLNGGYLALSLPFAIASFEGLLGEKNIIEVIEYAIEIGLFVRTEKGDVTSGRVQQALETRQQTSNAASTAGKLSAASRQRSFNSRSTVVERASTEEKREEEIRSDLDKNLATNAPASAREAEPPESPPKPKPELIPGCDIARATPEALERFCRDHSDPEMRKHYFDQIDVWLFSQKKSVQSGCCIKRLRNWIARNQREKRDWFATNGPPRGLHSSKLSAEELRKKNWEILEGKSNGSRTDDAIFESDDGGVSVFPANGGDSSVVG